MYSQKSKMVFAHLALNLNWLIKFNIYFRFSVFFLKIFKKNNNRQINYFASLSITLIPITHFIISQIKKTHLFNIIHTSV
jgi:hypothetical protein